MMGSLKSRGSEHQTGSSVVTILGNNVLNTCKKITWSSLPHQWALCCFRLPKSGAISTFQTRSRSCLCTCLLKCLTFGHCSKQTYGVMSVPPTTKRVLESEDATDETARGQELEAWTVGGTTAGERGFGLIWGLRKMQLPGLTNTWIPSIEVIKAPKRPYFGDGFHFFSVHKLARHLVQSVINVMLLFDILHKCVFEYLLLFFFWGAC